MEKALLDAWREEKLRFPLMKTDFPSDFPDIGEITTLDAPHRIADAIFVNSNMQDGTPFRESEKGKDFASATMKNATPLYRLCPTALIFGVWDSNAAAGGRGNKFPRALVSEIVGMDVAQNVTEGERATGGVRPAGRISPLGIRGTEAELYYKEGQQITYDEEESIEDNPSAKRLSEANLGNITPSTKDDRGNELHGGVTMDHAELKAVLSLAGLRKLRFPDDNGEISSERDYACRSVLASLGLTALCLQHERGYDLRSRCCLVPESPLEFEMVKNDGTSENFTLTSEQSIQMFEKSVEKARDEGIEWDKLEFELKPQDELLETLKRSRE